MTLVDTAVMNQSRCERSSVFVLGFVCVVIFLAGVPSFGLQTGRSNAKAQQEADEGDAAKHPKRESFSLGVHFGGEGEKAAGHEGAYGSTSG